jgi:hypothetical protein
MTISVEPLLYAFIAAATLFVVFGVAGLLIRASRRQISLLLTTVLFSALMFFGVILWRSPVGDAELSGHVSTMNGKLEVQNEDEPNPELKQALWRLDAAKVLADGSVEAWNTVSSEVRALVASEYIRIVESEIGRQFEGMQRLNMVFALRDCMETKIAAGTNFPHSRLSNLAASCLT